MTTAIGCGTSRSALLALLLITSGRARHSGSASGATDQQTQVAASNYTVLPTTWMVPEGARQNFSRKKVLN